ncbi:MAG: nucleotide exchange factor GrpE [Opitutae bacterium]|nr:nucleotide exchange factor GrpE [Opitutae bacterium]
MTKKHHHAPPAASPHAEEANRPVAETAPATDSEAAAPAAPPESPAEPQRTPEDVLQDRLLRLQADFENYRKRMDREKKDWIAFAAEKLLLDLLPVLDHFELGLADSAKSGAPAAFTEGFQLVCNQFRAVLEKAGVQAIDAEGAAFDPHLHEAITHLPSDAVPEGHVAAQTRRGYKLGDRLLRAAQVVVSSGPAA